MPCSRCFSTVHTDEAERVADCFDFDFSVCWSCAKEIFQEREQDQTMKNPCQDEGD